MTNWAFYPVFIGTLLSSAGWGYLIWNKHDRTRPRTLSELAADAHVLGYFRTVLWICGPLFALTLFFFIVPRSGSPIPLFIAGLGVVVFEMILGVFPARGRYDLLHNILSYAMGLSMLVLALLFALHLPGRYAAVEIIFTTAIAILGTCAMFDRKRFIYYEMPFIFASHISIVIAALALN